MRSAVAFGVGLMATVANGRVVPRAEIEDCLATSGVPFDTKGTPEWEKDAAVFNIRVPFIPAAIAVPKSTEHIQKSVLCGKKLGVKVSAKSGGHSYASLGFGGENGHLVVNLDRMYNVTLGADNIAVAQPGIR